MDNNSLDDFLRRLNEKMNSDDPIDEPEPIEFEDIMNQRQEQTPEKQRSNMKASLESVFDSNFDSVEDAVGKLHDGEKMVAMVLTDMAFEKVANGLGNVLAHTFAKGILLQCVGLVIQMLKFIEIGGGPDEDDYDDDDLEEYPY